MSGISEGISGNVAPRKRLCAIEMCNIVPDRSLDCGVMGRLKALAADGLDIQMPSEGTGKRVIVHIRISEMCLRETG